MEKQKKAWKSLQSFYKFKATLSPEFMQKNLRNLGDIEAKAIREYQNTLENPIQEISMKDLGKTRIFGQ